MIKRMDFYSKAIVETTKFDSSFAIISINNPASDTKIVGTPHILHLEFLDLEKESVDEEMIREGIAFNEDHAKSIISFINKISKDNSIDTLIVHCFAGISRSSAVSLSVYHYLKENNMLDNLDFPSHMQANYANNLVTSTFQRFLKEPIYVPTNEDAKNAKEEVLVYSQKMFKTLK